jgi:type II secretory pathway component GspD/PulD (secretin)
MKPARPHLLSNLIRLTLAAVLLVIVAPPAVTAQETTPSPVSQEDNGTYMLSQDLNVKALIGFVSDQLEISFVWDPTVETALNAASANVKLKMQRAIRIEELFDTLRVVLHSMTPGLAIVETEQAGLYRIVQSTQGTQAVDLIYILDEGETIPDDPENRATQITVVIPVATENAQLLTGALSQIIGQPGGSVMALGTSNLMMLSGRRARIVSALNVLALMEKTSDDFTWEIVHLENVEPQMVATAITQLLQITLQNRQQRQGAARAGVMAVAITGTQKLLLAGNGSEVDAMKVLIQQLDEGEPTRPRLYPARALTAERLADTLTQALSSAGTRGRQVAGTPVIEPLGGYVLVIGTPQQHERVEELVEQLESKATDELQQLRFYKVLNRSADEIVDVLEALFEEGAIQGSIDRERTGPRGGPPGTQQQAVQEASGAQPGDVGGGLSLSSGDDVLLRITLDEATNTILALGQRHLLDQVETVITDLDVRQPQVMLEFYLVSLSENESLDLGVELQGEFDVGATSFNLATAFGLSGIGDAGEGIGRGFTGLAVNPSDFRVLLRALQVIGAGKTISRPALLVNNNADATLDGVNSVPYASVNAGDTVSTTSLGGTEDAGTKLSITPQIAEGNHLILEYDVELSSFTGDATEIPGGGTLPPPSRSDSASSVVTIPDGYTIIVGGLQDSSETETTSKVPLIGDIPIVGELFTSRSISSQRNRLYIFIKASIYRGENFQGLRYLSAGDLRETELDTGFPTPEPLWID